MGYDGDERGESWVWERLTHSAASYTAHKRPCKARLETGYFRPYWVSKTVVKGFQFGHLRPPEATFRNVRMLSALEYIYTLRAQQCVLKSPGLMDRLYLHLIHRSHVFRFRSFLSLW